MGKNKKKIKILNWASQGISGFVSLSSRFPKGHEKPHNAQSALLGVKEKKELSLLSLSLLSRPHFLLVSLLHLYIIILCLISKPVAGARERGRRKKHPMMMMMMLTVMMKMNAKRRRGCQS